MVCIYCGGSTRVINSRHQRKTNSTWRRRECQSCGGLFTSHESFTLESALVVSKPKALEPFSRDKLWLSVYNSVGHRKQPLRDATALTETILTKLMPYVEQAKLDVDTITGVVLKILGHFDKAAASYYQAYHIG